MTTLDRRRFLGALGVAGASLAVSSVPAAARLRKVRSEAGTFFPWEEIRPGVYAAVSASQGGNVLTFKAADGGVVIDAKFAGMGPTLRREAEDLSEEIRFLINTHHHGDHTGGNVAFHDGATIIAHEKAEPRILAAFDQYRQQLQGAMRQLGAEIAPEVRKEAEALMAREAELTAAHWAPTLLFPKEPFKNPLHGDIAYHHFGPGHTDNDLVIILTRHDVMHAGDLCFHDLHSFFDRSGGCSARGWVKSVTKAYDLCGEKTVVVPGHGPVGDRSILEKQRVYVESLIESVSKEIRAGKSKEEVTAMSWPFMDGLGFEQVRPRAIGAVYDELIGEIQHP